MTSASTDDATTAPRPPVVTVISDLGLGDERVGVVHSILAQLAPGIRVVDLTHEVRPGDVRDGALRLARSVQWIAPGVVVAAVDPESAQHDRMVAIRLTGGSAHFVGPDNGVLAPAMAMIGGAEAAVSLDSPDFRLESPGRLDPVRDVLVPAAAALAMGTTIESLGAEVDPLELRPGLLPLPNESDGAFDAEVLAVDRRGDIQLNLQPEELAELGERIVIEFGERRRTLVSVDRRIDVGAGLGWWDDPSGMVGVIASGASAAEVLGLARGDGVTIRAAESDEDDAQVASVSLGRRPADEVEGGR